MDAPGNVVALVLAVGLGFVIIVRHLAKTQLTGRRLGHRPLPLPPGPKGLPLIGTVTGLPQEQPWEGYHSLCQKHGGEVFYFKAFGQGILVVDSWEWANELLEKRAVNYSNRPNATMLEMMGLQEWNFSVMQHNATWRQHRKAFHQSFRQTVVPQFHPIMIQERDRFIKNLAASPDDFLHHAEMFFGSTIMRATYGLDNPKKYEALIHNNEQLMAMFEEASIPGRFLVNIFPILRHIPAWFPGAGFHAFFAKFRQTAHDTVYTSFIEAKFQLEREDRSPYPNLLSTLLDRDPQVAMTQQELRDQEELARSVSGMAYIAGAETSFVSATVVFLILANHPEVQKRGQAEIDAIVGPDRLPLVADRPNLPYVHAIVKEIGRWFTAAPLGVAHASAEDDEYKGYFIPKDTLVLPNAWAMMHDPDVFEDPFEFKPERYLKYGEIDHTIPDAERAAFGFGRRICPGRFFSNDMLFLLTASLLSSFNVRRPLDENGHEIPLDLKTNSGLVAKPHKFQCRITPRARHS